MTITISLPPDIEESVKSQATKEGRPLADYVESLVEEGSKRRDRIDLLAEKSFDEILAPFRRSVGRAARAMKHSMPYSLKGERKLLARGEQGD